MLSAESNKMSRNTLSQGSNSELEKYIEAKNVTILYLKIVTLMTRSKKVCA